jgi:hypothetical protein
MMMPPSPHMHQVHLGVGNVVYQFTLKHNLLSGFNDLSLDSSCNYPGEQSNEGR